MQEQLRCRCCQWCPSCPILLLARVSSIEAQWNEVSWSSYFMVEANEGRRHWDKIFHFSLLLCMKVKKVQDRLLWWRLTLSEKKSQGTSYICYSQIITPQQEQFLYKCEFHHKGWSMDLFASENCKNSVSGLRSSETSHCSAEVTTFDPSSYLPPGPFPKLHTALSAKEPVAP